MILFFQQDRNSGGIRNSITRNYISYINTNRELNFSHPPIDPRRYNYQVFLFKSFSEFIVFLIFF